MTDSRNVRGQRRREVEPARIGGRLWVGLLLFGVVAFVVMVSVDF